METTRCFRCGTEVPTINFSLHTLRCGHLSPRTHVGGYPADARVATGGATAWLQPGPLAPSAQPEELTGDAELAAVSVTAPLAVPASIVNVCESSPIMTPVWTCPACSFDNGIHEISCGACCAPRPSGVTGDAQVYRGETDDMSSPYGRVARGEQLPSITQPMPVSGGHALALPQPAVDRRQLWNCARCTYENSENNDRCDMCDAMRHLRTSLRNDSPGLHTGAHPSAIAGSADDHEEGGADTVSGESAADRLLGSSRQLAAGAFTGALAGALLGVVLPALFCDEGTVLLGVLAGLSLGAICGGMLGRLALGGGRSLSSSARAARLRGLRRGVAQGIYLRNWTSASAATDGGQPHAEQLLLDPPELELERQILHQDGAAAPRPVAVDRWQRVRLIRRHQARLHALQEEVARLQSDPAAGPLQAEGPRNALLRQLVRFHVGINQEAAAPANGRAIVSLPTHTVTQADAAGVPDEHKACTICMEEFRVGDEQRTLPCFHRFHTGCVDRWLRRSGTCPICKLRVDGRESVV